MAKTKVSKSGKGCSLEGLGETSILFNHKGYKPSFFQFNSKEKLKKRCGNCIAKKLQRLGSTSNSKSGTPCFQFNHWNYPRKISG